MGGSMARKKLWRITMKIFCVLIILNSCHSNNLPYQHLDLSDNQDEIVVEKFISLETEKTVGGNQVVKIVTSPTDSNGHKTRHPGKRKNSDHDLMTSDPDLVTLVNELQGKIQDLEAARDSDRKQLAKLEKKLEEYHDEAIISSAEVVQIRQIVSESFDKASLLEETTQDNSLQIEGLVSFQKEASRDLRRLKEYKEERAAKRFHQLTNAVEKCENQIELVQRDLRNLTQELQTIYHFQSNSEHDINAIKLDHTHIKQGQQDLRESIFYTQSHINETLENITSCCNTQNQLTNQRQQYSSTDQPSKKLINEIKEQNTLFSDIAIVEFGSGETHEKLDFQENGESYLENPEHGSGETFREGSGDISNGETDLPQFLDLSKYVHKNEFAEEKRKWETERSKLLDSYENMTKHIAELEAKIGSIKLGNFMQTLQDSLINFTQNVITLEQWQVSSNQMVNSTLQNQDQILKISNMVLDNTDKMADLRWKVSNVEVLNEQQFSILKMYIIRLNNSVEDIKEQMKMFERKQTFGAKKVQYQPAYYGYQTVYKTKSEFSENEYQSPDINDAQLEDEIELLKSHVDDLGLQIIFNQNRLANLEVKLLNDSLQACQKLNIDADQDSQLASHDAILKSNMNSITLLHQYMKELDNSIRALSYEVKTNLQRTRSTSENLNSLRGIIPAVLGIKKEVDNFLFTLPKDCDEYYQRGYKKSGVHVIHPVGADFSRHVMCHMTENGGWTVIQQRFNGSVDFQRNWTDYAKGFGNADSEYWFGNYLVHLLTAHENYSLNVVMVDSDENTWTATYDDFSVSLPEDKYTLHVEGYSGNATDSLGYLSGMAFSTRDRDNDASSTNCAFFYQSGWWYKHCQTCNLNGRYDIGMVWFNQETNSWMRMKSTVMQIRAR